MPYFVNELSGYELTASNVKRVISMLDEQDKKQLLNIMKVEDIDKLKDEDFIWKYLFKWIILENGLQNYFLKELFKRIYLKELFKK